MTSFDDREKRFEAEFAHNAELKFKVEARRNKLVGLWAAEKLGLSGDEAETYAKSVARADMEEAGDEDVFRKLRTDLNESREKITDEQIREQMRAKLEEAMNAMKGSK